MVTTERVTVTLARDLLEGIDRLERNRSRFIAEAVRHELERRRREALEVSLRSPHPESAELAEMGMAEWSEGASEGDSELVDTEGGTAVSWTPGEGWKRGVK